MQVQVMTGVEYSISIASVDLTTGVMGNQRQGLNTPVQNVKGANVKYNLGRLIQAMEAGRKGGCLDVKMPRPEKGTSGRIVFNVSVDVADHLTNAFVKNTSVDPEKMVSGSFMLEVGNFNLDDSLPRSTWVNLLNYAAGADVDIRKTIKPIEEPSKPAIYMVELKYGQVNKVSKLEYWQVALIEGAKSFIPVRAGDEKEARRIALKIWDSYFEAANRKPSEE